MSISDERGRLAKDASLSHEQQVETAKTLKDKGHSNASIAHIMRLSENTVRILLSSPKPDFIPLSLMSKYLGQEVNVILKDGTSLWRPLTGVKTAHIELDDNGIWLPQDAIRSFGTRDEGILMEVSQ